jgi:tRNA(adenine34) deaminase
LVTDEQVRRLIRECQKEASKAIETGDPPFGCIISDGSGRIVVRAHNTQHSSTDPTAHAEINALRQLAQDLKTGDLRDHIMFTNASSCSMCMSASIKAHVTQFYFGAPPEPTMDPWLPMEEVAAKARQQVEVHGPFLGDECAAQIALGRSLSPTETS